MHLSREAAPLRPQGTGKEKPEELDLGKSGYGPESAVVIGCLLKTNMELKCCVYTSIRSTARRGRKRAHSR